MNRLAFVIALAGGCAGSTEESTTTTMPRAAQATIDRESHGATLREVERERDGGYEASWIADGVAHEAKVTATGQLVEHEVEVPLDKLPATVLATVQRELAGGTKLEVVRLMSGRFKAEARFGAKEREITIGPDGAVIGNAGDDDDDGEDDEDDHD